MNCLSPAQLEALAQQRLPDDSEASFRAHLDECATCQSSFDVVLKNEDALNRIKRLVPDTATTDRDCFINQRDLIPGYEIVDRLKEGGQGVVYRAVQHSTKRDVAIKVLREGPFANTSEMARFEREVEILAQLRHPNIVAIHDSGLAGSHYYFVMSLIDGEPIDVWWSNQTSEKNARDRRAVIECFADLCEAVNAAHLRGIMHRDLKPSNVIVDATGKPFVLDFGLARPTDGMNEQMTVTGQFVGSLPWASPEQAQGIASGVDIRTDVYSLGVMLYQALCGQFPYDVVGGVHEVLDRIINATPSRPSAVAQTNLDEELDAIALKCLEKQPKDRYQTAGELARDLRAYLAGEPISAKQHSFAYLLRKQVQRHRVPVMMAATLMLVVTIGFVVTLGLWRQSERLRLEVEDQKQVAVSAQQAEATQRQAALVSRDQAIAAFERSDAVRQFLQDMLQAVDPNFAGDDRDITVRQILDRAAADVDADSLKDHPHVESAIRDTIGTSYQNLGLLDEAQRHLERSLAIQRTLGNDDPRGLYNALNSLATILQHHGAYEQAESLFREALDHSQREYENAEYDSIQAKNNLAVILMVRGKLTEATKFIDEIMKNVDAIEAEDSYSASAMLASAGMLKMQLGEIDDAVAIFRRVLETRLASLGEAHPSTTQVMSNLGLLLERQGQYDEAEKLLRRAIELDERIFSKDSAKVATDLNNLSMVLSSQDKHDEAISVLRRAIELRRKLLPKHHPETIIGLLNLSDSLMATGQFGATQPLLEEVLAAPESAIPKRPFAKELIRLMYMASIAANGDRARAEAMMHELKDEFSSNAAIPEDLRAQLAEFETTFNQTGDDQISKHVDASSKD